METTPNEMVFLVLVALPLYFVAHRGGNIVARQDVPPFEDLYVGEKLLASASCVLEFDRITSARGFAYLTDMRIIWVPRSGPAAIEPVLTPDDVTLSEVRTVRTRFRPSAVLHVLEVQTADHVLHFHLTGKLPDLLGISVSNAWAAHIRRLAKRLVPDGEHFAPPPPDEDIVHTLRERSKMPAFLVVALILLFTAKILRLGGLFAAETMLVVVAIACLAIAFVLWRSNRRNNA